MNTIMNVRFWQSTVIKSSNITDENPPRSWARNHNCQELWMKSVYRICRHSLWNRVWKVRAPHPNSLTSVCIRREIAPVKTNPAAHRGSLLGWGGSRHEDARYPVGRQTIGGGGGREELTLSHNGIVTFNFSAWSICWKSREHYSQLTLLMSECTTTLKCIFMVFQSARNSYPPNISGPTAI